MGKCRDCLHFEVCKKYDAIVDFDVDDGVCLYFEKKIVCSLYNELFSFRGLTDDDLGGDTK